MSTSRWVDGISGRCTACKRRFRVTRAELEQTRRLATPNPGETRISDAVLASLMEYCGPCLNDTHVRPGEYID